MESKRYDRQYFEQRDYLIPYLAASIKYFCKKNKIEKVLDVGCGTGQLVKFLNNNGLIAYGCDNSQHAISMASSKLVKKGSATKLPFNSKAFDLITLISVIEHLKAKDAEKFLKEAKRVLKMKGYLIIVTPNYATPLRIIQGKNWFGFKDKTHINFYTPKSLSITLGKNGFTTLKEKIKVDNSFDSFLPAKLRHLPSLARLILIYLFFQTPFSVLRNSFWILAQKND